jgi:hypothetical protein
VDPLILPLCCGSAEGLAIAPSFSVVLWRRVWGRTQMPVKTSANVDSHHRLANFSPSVASTQQFPSPTPPQ